MNHSKNSDPTPNSQLEKLENSQVKITGELPAEQLEAARSKALDKLRQTAEIDGFRSGEAPDEILLNKYGEMGVLQQAAEVALTEAYPEILAEHQVQPLGQPQVSITKLAPGDALGFEIVTAVMPEIELPYYKQVAAEVLREQSGETQEMAVTEEEVEDTILQVRRNVAQERRQQSGIETTDPDEALPELTDELVQSLGNYSSVDDFRARLKEDLQEQKRRQQREKRRMAVLEALIERSEIDLPEVVVNSELDRLMTQLKSDLERAGLNMENYLQQVGKNEEQLWEEWRPQAVKKAKIQLILNRIAATEQLSPDQDQVNQHLEQVMSQHSEANREQAKVFVETQLLNEQALALLEDQDPVTNKESAGANDAEEKIDPAKTTDSRPETSEDRSETAETEKDS